MQINRYLYDFKNEQKLSLLCTKFSISFRPTKQLLVKCPKPNRKSAIFYFVLIFGIQMIATKQEVAVTWLHMVESTPVLTCLVRVPAWAHLCTDVCFQLQHLLVAAGNDIFHYLYVLLLEGVRKSLTPCWRYTGKIVVSSWTPVRYYFTQLDHRSFLELSQHSPPLLPLDSWAFDIRFALAARFSACNLWGSVPSLSDVAKTCWDAAASPTASLLLIEIWFNIKAKVPLHQLCVL